MALSLRCRLFVKPCLCPFFGPPKRPRSYAAATVRLISRTLTSCWKSLMTGCSARHWTVLFIHSTHYSHRSPQHRNTITSDNVHTTDNCQHTVDTYLIETLYHEYCINTLTENTIACYCTQTVNTLIVVLINCVLSVSNKEYDDDDDDDDDAAAAIRRANYSVSYFSYPNGTPPHT